MSVALKIPLDFERRETVRLLARKIAATAEGSNIPPASGTVLATALRIWIDWAQAGKEFRALRCRAMNDNAQVDWAKEDLTYVIEGAAAWPGPAGDLMRAALEAGFIQIDRRGDDYGLLLDGFWPLNEHLSPDYQTIQKRGGHAAAAKRSAKEAERFAAQRRELFEKQGILPFGATEVTTEEQELCYALFIRLYRLCEFPELPSTEKFTEDAMSAALGVVRNFTVEQITAVEEYILANRDNPEVVKIPERILEHFGTYAEKAGAL